MVFFLVLVFVLSCLVLALGLAPEPLASSPSSSMPLLLSHASNVTLYAASSRRSGSPPQPRMKVRSTYSRARRLYDACSVCAPLTRCVTRGDTTHAVDRLKSAWSAAAYSCERMSTRADGPRLGASAQ